MKQGQAIIASVLAGIGASLCCVAPLALLSLGLGGAWVAHLTKLEPVRPLLVVMTLFFLGLAFHKLYLAPPVCEMGKPCSDPRILRRQRFLFWVVILPLLGLLAFPWLGPLFY
ncbi:MAG: mercury transporter MerT [Alphaproteobacteria bacterium]|nr:mercury transporter MerT [Alphaproteobacteria bacterium]